MSCYFHGDSGCDCDNKIEEPAEKHINILKPLSYKVKVHEEAEVAIDSINGIRVFWSSSNGYSVQRKDSDGVWYNATGIKSINIVFSCEEPLPIITINEIAVSATKGI